MSNDAPASASKDATNAPWPETGRKTGYPFLFRCLHWILTASGIVLVLTGISLHAGSRPDWSLLGGKVPGWLWSGRVHYWHAWAALAFTPSILAACWVYVRRRVYFRPTHLILLLGGMLTVVSGFFLANPPSSDQLYSIMLWIHAVVGLVVFPAWMIWHIITGFSKYLRVLVPAFHPWARPEVLSVYGFVALALITSLVLLNGWPFALPWRDLIAERIEQQEVTDLATLPWDDAQPLKIQLANGNAMDAGRTKMDLRALHDGNELFVRAEWVDDDEEYNYWPWKKTDEGWEYMQTSAKDECRCYEDKFSMIFPTQPDGDFERFGCAVSCHMHQDYGWGYKGTDRWVDVWHWKAARTGTSKQVDDKYWDRPDFDNKDIGRYGDPKDGGGYEKNRKDGVDHPVYLPDPPDAVFHGSILRGREVEYTDSAGAAIASGTIIPGVVSEAFQGDRGNVSCESEYVDGHWILFIRRPLLTHSAHDVQFLPGRRHAFGCAAFDHSGKRHAYALPTFHLRLAE